MVPCERVLAAPANGQQEAPIILCLLQQGVHTSLGIHIPANNCWVAACRSASRHRCRDTGTEGQSAANPDSLAATSCCDCALPAMHAGMAWEDQPWDERIMALTELSPAERAAAFHLISLLPGDEKEPGQGHSLRKRLGAAGRYKPETQRRLKLSCTCWPARVAPALSGNALAKRVLTPPCFSASCNPQACYDARINAHCLQDTSSAFARQWRSVCPGLNTRHPELTHCQGGRITHAQPSGAMERFC